MEYKSRFEVSFYGHDKVEVDNYSRSEYTVNKQDLFVADSGGDACFERAGYINLVATLKERDFFSLTIPSGRLVGKITKVTREEEERDLRVERGLMSCGSGPVTTIIVDGIWKGAKGGLLYGDSAAASFRPIDGDIADEWKSMAKSTAQQMIDARPEASPELRKELEATIELVSKYFKAVV